MVHFDIFQDVSMFDNCCRYETSERPSFHFIIWIFVIFQTIPSLTSHKILIMFKINMILLFTIHDQSSPIDSCCWDRYNKHKEANLKLSITNEDPADEVEHQSLLSDYENQWIETNRFHAFLDPILMGGDQRGVLTTFEKLKRKYKASIWTCLEEPNSSYLAKVSRINF